MGSIRRWASWRSCAGLALGGILLAAGVLAPDGAAAFDFFGLFGSEKSPEPTPTTLPYEVTFEIDGDESVKRALEESSSLYQLRRDPPPDAPSLAQRLEADFGPMIDALWGEGYYNARVSAVVGGTPVPLGQDRGEAAARAAASYQGRAVVPVTIKVETGPLFTLSHVAVVSLTSRQPFPPEVLPPYVLKLEPGDPARAADLRAANARLVDYFRDQGHPLVKAPLPQPTVNHAALTMDVTFTVDPGPKAGFGEVSLTGPETFDPSIVRSFIYLEPGQPYSPKALTSMRRSITSIPAVGAVRIREAEKLDSQGNLPIFVEVGDRARNLLGFTLGYSNVDGPTGSTYYENRNLFGGAESLRLAGDLFYSPPVYGITTTGPGGVNYSDSGPGARVTASFVKPALYGSRFDFLLDGIAERDRSGGGDFGGYVDELAGGTMALRYRPTQELALQGGVKFEKGQATDSLGRVDYTFFGFPLQLRYDGTDSLLNPTSGARVLATLTPYPSWFGNSGFTQAIVAGSAYFAMDESADYVVAVRGGFGSIFGDTGDLANIPANYRFYRGGLATIRGYRDQSVGPFGPTVYVVGGRSAFNATIEARIKVTEDIGVAPFFDVGGAFIGSTPFGSQGDTRIGAGVGLLYYTPIGPLRVDVARPLNPRHGDYPVVFYVSIGQPF